MQQVQVFQQPQVMVMHPQLGLQTAQFQGASLQAASMQAAGFQGVQSVGVGVQSLGVPNVNLMQVPQTVSATTVNTVNGQQFVVVPQMMMMPQMQQIPQIPQIPQMQFLPCVLPQQQQFQENEELNRKGSFVSEVSESLVSENGSRSSTDVTEVKELGAPVLSAILRASGNTPVTGLAGALAKRLRGKQEVIIEAMGPSSVAQTMRALTLARSFLFQEKIVIVGHSDFMFAPARDEVSQSPHPGLRFTIKGMEETEDPVVTEVLKVKDDSVVGKAAGAIAKLVRSSGSKGMTVGIVFGPSPRAINLAAKSVTLARAMLKGDDLDIQIQPKMPEQRGGVRIQPEDQVLEFVVNTVFSKN